MTQASMHKIAWSVLTACIGLLSGQTAFAQDSTLSKETEDRILGPLLANETLRSDINLEQSASYIRFGVLQDGASRIGREVLRAQNDVLFNSAFAGLDSPSAYLTDAPGGRVSISVYDASSDESLFRLLSPRYVEAGGVPIIGTIRSQEQNFAVLYESGFDAPGSADGLDFGVAQRTAVSLGSDGPAYEAGASVRLGQYLTQSDSEPAWWFFAGADRQALLYDPSQGFNMRNAVAMESYALVGDAQAGVAVKAFGADLSLAYIHRETTFSLPTHSWDSNEGFAAFSLTIRR